MQRMVSPKRRSGSSSVLDVEDDCLSAGMCLFREVQQL